MSFYDDYVADGLCCASCGGLLDGGEPGFSRFCVGCSPDDAPDEMRGPDKPARYPPEVKAAKPYSCQIDGCGKRFATQAAKRSHRKHKHGAAR